MYDVDFLKDYLQQGTDEKHFRITPAFKVQVKEQIREAASPCLFLYPCIWESTKEKKRWGTHTTQKKDDGRLMWMNAFYTHIWYPLHMELLHYGCDNTLCYSLVILHLHMYLYIHTCISCMEHVTQDKRCVLQEIGNQQIKMPMHAPDAQFGFEMCHLPRSIRILLFSIQRWGLISAPRTAASTSLLWQLERADFCFEVWSVSTH